jgi:hypothetical protein
VTQASGQSTSSGLDLERRAKDVLNDLARKQTAVSSLEATVKAVCPEFQMASWGVDSLSRNLALLLTEAESATTLAGARDNIKALRQKYQTDLQQAEENAQALRRAIVRALGLSTDASPDEIVTATNSLRTVSQATQNAFRSADNSRQVASIPEALWQLQQWCRELGGGDNLSRLVDAGKSRISGLNSQISAKDEALRPLEAAGRMLSQLEAVLDARRDQVVSVVSQQKQDITALRARNEELEPRIERGMQAEELAKAWDGFIRPVMTEHLAYSVPELSSAAKLHDFKTLLETEHPASRLLRLALVVANMDQSNALTAAREAGRDDVLAALGFQTINQDLLELFPKGTRIAKDKDTVWSDLVGPGLNTGTLVRVFRAKVLLEGYYAADPVFLPLRQLVNAFSAELLKICHKAGCRITIPTILGPPQAGVDQHWDALPELRRLPEVRKRLEDAITRREAIVVDIHNIGVASPTDTVRPGVVMLNPADW